MAQAEFTQAYRRGNTALEALKLHYPNSDEWKLDKAAEAARHWLPQRCGARRQGRHVPKTGGHRDRRQMQLGGKCYPTLERTRTYGGAREAWTALALVGTAQSKQNVAPVHADEGPLKIWTKPACTASQGSESQERACPHPVAPIQSRSPEAI